MVSVDISNVWGEVSLQELLALEKEVAAAHEALPERNREAADLMPILEAARRIREDSEVCVILGTDTACMGARAAVEFLQGKAYNRKKETKLFFAGNTLSTRAWNTLMEQLEGKHFSVIVVSESGADMEPALALRSLRWMLERKHGTDKASRRIYAVTNPEQGFLGQMARDAGWKLFSVSADSVLTAAGLLPMAVAGIDVEQLLLGAEEAEEAFEAGSLENPVWQYAAVRNLMYRSGKAVEVLSFWEPEFLGLGHWWQQLFARKEGREGEGLFPAIAELPGDHKGLEQLIRQGKRNLFETMVRFAPTEQKHTIGSQWEDPDGLNYLEGKTLDQVEEQTFFDTVDTHVDSGVPVINLECGAPDEKTLGELFRFMELSCAVSARVLGVVHEQTSEE